MTFQVNVVEAIRAAFAKYARKPSHPALFVVDATLRDLIGPIPEEDATEFYTNSAGLHLPARQLIAGRSYYAVCLNREVVFYVWILGRRVEILCPHDHHDKIRRKRLEYQH